MTSTKQPGFLHCTKYVPFQADRHLIQERPQRCYTMEELGYNNNCGISKIALSSSFGLFTEEAIDLMKAEALSDTVQRNFTYSSDLAPKQIRGYAPSHAKFVAEAWSHPDTLKIISDIAGIDLVPVTNYEIGHVNIGINTDDQFANSSKEGQPAVVGWHRDSYPFVCVVMLSDATNMLGGEMVVKKKDGDVLRITSRGKGHGMILQGRYIEHKARQAEGLAERITMVTSFRPRNPLLRDDSVLTTVRAVSNLSDLYGQFVGYNLENLLFRTRRIIDHTTKTMKTGATDVVALKTFLMGEIRVLQHLLEQIVEEDEVQKGFVLRDVGHALGKGDVFSHDQPDRMREW